MNEAAPISRRRLVFERALDLPAAERSAFVERECADVVDLCRDVLQLLAEDDDPLDALGERIVPISRSVLSEPAHHCGQRIGVYRLMAEIDSGGMGTVFRAERDDGEFNQRVAIELIRGYPTREAMQRFKRERELLSQLAHPHIARLLDGGSTEAGQPWLAMEYIASQPLRDWLEIEPSGATPALQNPNDTAHRRGGRVHASTPGCRSRRRSSGSSVPAYCNR